MKAFSFAIVLVMELMLLALGLNGMLSEVTFGETTQFSKDPVLELLVPAAFRGAVAMAGEPKGSSANRVDKFAVEADRYARSRARWSRAFWTAIFCLPLAHWISLIAARKRHRSIPIKTSSSESISIYESAIVDFVGNALGEVPAVLGHHIVVKQQGDGLALRIRVKLSPVDHIPTVQSQIESVIRRRVTDLLGIHKIHEIAVEVEGFGKFERRPQEAIPAPAVAAEVPTASGMDRATSRPDEVVLKHVDDPAPAEPNAADLREITLHPPGAHPEPAKVVPASTAADDQDAEEVGPYGKGV